MTILAHNMLNRILDNRREKLHGYVTAALPSLPADEELQAYSSAWRIGLDSAMTYRSTKRVNLRFVVAGKVEQVGDLLLTSSNVNFDYLHFHNAAYHDKHRSSPRQIREFKKPAKFPTFAEPYEGLALYFDMKAFYANLMLVFGRGLDYLPGEYLEARPNNLDYPFWHNKDFRNRLHSSANTGGGSFRIVNKKKAVKHIDAPDSFSNPALIRFTLDLSTFIGELMILYAGAIYGNVDGYIVPLDRADDAIRVLSEIGLPFDVKDGGLCLIKSYGCYRFAPSPFNPAGKVANTARLKMKAQPRPYRRLQEIDLEWFWQQIEPHIVHANEHGSLLYADRSPESLSSTIYNYREAAFSSASDRTFTH